MKHTLFLLFPIFLLTDCCGIREKDGIVTINPSMIRYDWSEFEIPDSGSLTIRISNGKRRVRSFLFTDGFSSGTLTLTFNRDIPPIVLSPNSLTAGNETFALEDGKKNGLIFHLELTKGQSELWISALNLTHESYSAILPISMDSDLELTFIQSADFTGKARYRIGSNWYY